MKRSLTLQSFCIVLSVLRFADYVASLSVIGVNVTEENSRPLLVANIAADPRLQDKYKPDVIAGLSFKVLPQSQHAAYFQLEESSGRLYIYPGIDKEKVCFGFTDCSVSIDIGIYPAVYFEVFRINVNILDINDNSPVFPSSHINKSVSEAKPLGTEIPLPLATDADGGVNGITAYVLDNNDVFTLHEVKNTEGEITSIGLSLQKTLDREQNSFYRFNVTAIDGGLPSKHGTLSVFLNVLDVNDNAPVIKDITQPVTVPEDAKPGTFLFKLQADDLDSGPNGQITFRLSAQSHAAFGSLFEVNAVTGVVYTKGSLDYENTASYDLNVIAEDNGPERLATRAVLTIHVLDVNDHRPLISIDNNGSLVVSEDADLGFVVTYVSVVDLDSGANGRFTCTVDASQFELQRFYTSQFQLVVSGTLDREAQDVYTLVISCTDQGEQQLTSEQTIVIKVKDINDNNPVFSQTQYIVRARENNQVGLQLVQVEATDKDAGDYGHVEYYVTRDVMETVTIHPDTGVITAAVQFNREQIDEYRFNVFARDKGTPARSGVAVVTIRVLDANDERPLYKQRTYHFEVLENHAPNTSIGFVTATDADLSPFNQFKYQLSDSTSPAGLFKLDPISGQLWCLRTLDFEERSYYELIAVTVDIDEPALRDTARIHVKVLDVNDNTPEIIYPSDNNRTVQIPLMSPIGQEVAKISAYDRDSGLNGLLTYEIYHHDNVSYIPFHVKPKSGVICTSISLSFESIYVLDVFVTDNGLPKRSAKTLLTVIVNSSLEINVDAPQYTEEPNRYIIVALTVVFIFLSFLLMFAIFVVLKRKRAAEARENLRKTENYPVVISHCGHWDTQYNEGAHQVALKENGYCVQDPDGSDGRRSDNTDSGYSGDTCRSGLGQYEMQSGRNSPAREDPCHHIGGYSAKLTSCGSPCGHPDQWSSSSSNTCSIQNNQNDQRLNNGVIPFKDNRTSSHRQLWQKNRDRLKRSSIGSVNTDKSSSHHNTSAGHSTPEKNLLRKQVRFKTETCAPAKPARADGLVWDHCNPSVVV